MFTYILWFYKVTKLIEDATSSKTPRQKTAMSINKIQEWLVENKVLSIALEGMYSELLIFLPWESINFEKILVI